jgi:hypothetical protein
MMNEMRVARGLGWFSIGLGVTEVAAGYALGCWLGMENRTWLLRAFGIREIATGIAVLTQEPPRGAMWGRVAGDVLDLAALASGLSEDNPKRENVALAIGTVAGITALDYWCARRLHSARPHGSERLHRLYAAKAPAEPAEARDDPAEVASRQV